jgi:hypothetical protein
VTLAEISSLFHDHEYQKVNQTGNSNPLLARANATDLTRLALPLSWLDPSGEANPKLLTYNNTPGSLGQILYSYGMNAINFNASLTKTSRITERSRFQLYATANNVLNHPAWGLPNANTSSSGFETVGAPSGSRSMTFHGVLNF